MRIDKFFNTKNTQPLIIAELSGNHNNSIKIAKKIISEVSKSGAQMIKFQTFSLDEMTFNLKKNIFKITNRTTLGLSITMIYIKNLSCLFAI